MNVKKEILRSIWSKLAKQTVVEHLLGETYEDVSTASVEMEQTCTVNTFNFNSLVCLVFLLKF